ncbi:HEAT repeat domain-containing protein [Flavobacterium sp. K5-23]|uniref:HEAT repeat domain-containing protein n=1 Tax=Flavobacterium sp. K5-23 TaxID=2746225 RepID=UPI00200BE609|nr:HEAT repeat domain-containing protein [Flavobacterium sp. K5-23]UQD56434.1 hypothetical protein FLAK523_08590 [Flavobacterium sp. K5-23]
MESYQYIIEFITQYPPIIYWAWILSGVFILIITFLIIYLKYLRNRLRSKERIQKTYQKKYESELITYLYSGNEEEEISIEQQNIINYFKKHSNSGLKRKIIIATLLKLKNDISGEMADSIQNLYYQTELVNYPTGKLKSKSWDIIAKSIRELTQFQIKESYDAVTHHVNHPKREVRKEVQMYLVNLFYFKGLDFLNVLKSHLTEWDQIQLLEILQKFDNQHIPNINDWLKSSNDSVVVFTLKLAKIYNQFEAKDELLLLLDHQNKSIRVDAINVLAHLNAVEAIPIIKKEFSNRSLEEQIAFFNMLQNMNDISDIPFILDYLNKDNFEIRISAIKILKELNFDNFNTFKMMPTDPKIDENVKFIETA